MTIRYVGPGGSDGADGLSWANRKLTLNGVEDTPVVAGDTIYVGPGTYRELWTVDVNGTSGNMITYIGDVTGENTDGIGGIVRITGLTSEDSYPATRSKLIYIFEKNYRAFRGFYFDGSTGSAEASSSLANPYIDYELGYNDVELSDITIEFCVFGTSACSTSTGLLGIHFYYNNQTFANNIIIRNCVGMVGIDHVVTFDPQSSCSHDALITNLLCYGQVGYPVVVRTGNNVTIYGLTVCDSFSAVSQASSYTYIYDSFIHNMYTCWSPNTGAGLVRDYLLLSGAWELDTPEANDIISYLPLSLPIQFAGYKFPWDYLAPSVAYNDNVYTSDTGTLTKDIYGLPRPGGDKFTRGAVQFRGVTRDSSEYKIAPSSARMDDASQQLFRVPIDAAKKITVTIYVKREANYAGTNPQLTVRLSTSGATTDTDTGSVGVYNKLTVVVTPGANDRWAQIELTSNNTASSGSYKVWFDEFRIQTSKGVIPTMKWATNEIPLFCFALRKLADPWITPTIPVPTQVPLTDTYNIVPSFYRQT